MFRDNDNDNDDDDDDDDDDVGTPSEPEIKPNNTAQHYHQRNHGNDLGDDGHAIPPAAAAGYEASVRTIRVIYYFSAQ
jgi:hypothetical protein